MPSAVASFDDAFDMEEPARKKAPRPRAAPAAKRPARNGKKARRLPFGFDGRRVARCCAIGLSGTLVVAIMINALLLQKGHHPAPLFGNAIALGPSPAPAPKAAPAQRTSVPAPETEEMAPPPSTPAPHGAGATNEAMPPSDDAIAALIAGRVPPPSKAESKTVLGAQKALAKLGFALKPSGTMGPQTRKAIEAFERDRHLPVKGELSHRVVRILAAESGVRID